MMTTQALDSPYCPLCITHGKVLNNTYKVAGKPYFRCGVCKNIMPVDQFDMEDMKWRTNPELWKKNMIAKGVEPKILKAKK